MKLTKYAWHFNSCTFSRKDFRSVMKFKIQLRSMLVDLNFGQFYSRKDATVRNIFCGMQVIPKVLQNLMRSCQSHVVMG